MTMTRLPLTPRRRLLLWSGLLAAFQLIDLTLTTIALQGLGGAAELNPIAALAFETSLLWAIGLKLVAIGLVIILALAIAPTPKARATERVLAAWCCLLLAVNAWSALQLFGVI